MELRSNTERPAIRFAPYIQELREFFRGRGLRYGTPEDIVALAEGLGSPGSLHDEMTSMVRSVIFRERGVVAMSELVELILVAVSGGKADLPAQEVAAPVAVLSDFVGEVLESLKRKSFVEEDELEADKPDPFSDALAETQGVAEGAVYRTPASREVGNFVVEAEWRFSGEKEPALAHLAGEALDRAQMLSRDFAERDESSRPLPARSRSLEAGEIAAFERTREAVPPPRFFRNTMWTLLVLLAAVVSWRHWHPVSVREPVRVGEAGPVPDLAHVAPGSLAARDTDLRDGGSSQGALTTAHVNAPPVTTYGGVTPDAGLGGAGTRLPIAGVQGNPVPPVGSASSGGGTDGSKVSPAAPQRREASHPPQRSAAVPVGVVQQNPANKQGGFLVSSGVMDGNLIASPAPKYPRMASMAGVEGQVILQAVVSRNGTVVATHVLEGHHLLRGAAARAVRGWKYRPYMVRGKPTDVATIVIVDFHLPH